MNSTDTISVDDLARSLFDEVVVPSAEAMRDAGHLGYFARAGEPGSTSYFEPPSLAVMQSSDFDFPGGGDAEGLIDAATQYWMTQGEKGLANLAPQLKRIARALQNEAADNNGDVDILCYTMF